LGEIKNIYINWKHLGKVHQSNQIWVMAYTRASMKFRYN